MSDYRAEILTNWIGTGVGEDHNRPQLTDDYPIKAWVDVTSGTEHPDPNIYVIFVVVDQATLDAIEADPNYWIESADEIIEEVM